MAIYQGEWEGYESMRVDCRDYPDTEMPKPEEIVYASYNTPPYEGCALLVWERGGVLYEQNDGHCSCHGLEEWRPEVTSLAALRMRPFDKYDDPVPDDEPSRLHEALDAWDAHGR